MQARLRVVVQFQFELKRELRSIDESGMLTPCLNAQAGNVRMQIRSLPELSPLRPAKPRQRFAARRRILPLLRSESLAEAKAEKHGLRICRQRSEKRLQN